MADPSLLPVDSLYKGRRDFTIIGLTGIAGSGCSKLAEYMSGRNFLDFVRKPSEIHLIETANDDNDIAYQQDKQGLNNKALGSLVFMRKYTICYNFATAHYQPYRVIKYTHVLWLFTLLRIKEKLGTVSASDLRQHLLIILKDKFRPSVTHDDDDYKEAINYSDEVREQFIQTWLNQFSEWEKLTNSLNALSRCYIDNLSDSKTGIPELYKFFAASQEFKSFVSKMLKTFAEEDYYSLCFLHHRLAFQIRRTSDLFETHAKIFDEQEQGFEHLFDVARLINILIKGYKHEADTKGANCGIVIDSMRNSLEAVFLRERYSAFYLIAVNDSDSRELNLLDSIRQKMPKTVTDEDLLSSVLAKVKDLSITEVKSSDHAKGKFSSPDIENVIAEAEIHISNPYKENKEKPTGGCYEFVSMAEQWMKYSSLILHPGLITPSAEERCMVVAHTAKLNSSCLSRQVGAVITNQYHSIRTIGWNEVPYGQLPCGLKELDQLGNSQCENCIHVFSEFERTPHNHYHGLSFAEKVNEDYPTLTQDIQSDALKGLPYSYCFKTLHNRYEGDKNQVFTRSLHAEENAILQMAKYGGEPLMNGIIYVTASPCELCSKKLYQIGVRKIVYIDPYPGIARQQIIAAGFKRPQLKLFQGAYGSTYFKLYQPFISYKDELSIRTNHSNMIKPANDLLKKILKEFDIEEKESYNVDEINDILNKIAGSNKVCNVLKTLERLVGKLKKSNSL